MRRQRVIIGAAGGLTAAALAATVWAQPPTAVPLPVPPTGPAPQVVCETRGPLRRAAGRTFHVLQDNLIGYPQEFADPPLGSFNREVFGVMRAKADPHRFTLYKSDFLDGTARFSPNGASRFNLMSARMRSSLGPLLVEWTPDQPELAQARRAAVLETLKSLGQPVIPERVVIGPSPYPGIPGSIADARIKTYLQGGSTLGTGAGGGGGGGGAFDNQAGGLP